MNEEFCLSKKAYTCDGVEDDGTPIMRRILAGNISQEWLNVSDVKEFIFNRLRFEWNSVLINGQYWITVNQLNDFFNKLKEEAGEDLV